MGHADKINKEQNPDPKDLYIKYTMKGFFAALAEKYQDNQLHKAAIVNLKKHYESVSSDKLEPYFDLSEIIKTAREKNPETYKVYVEELARMLQVERMARKDALTLSFTAQDMAYNKYQESLYKSKDQQPSPDSDAQGNAEVLPDPSSNLYWMGKLFGLFKTSTSPDKELSTEEAVEKLNEVISKSLRAIFSITSHPTNPTSTDFTIATARYGEVSLPGTDEDRKAKLKDLVNAKLVGNKKTVDEEFEEGLTTLKVIYGAVDKVYLDYYNSIETSFNHARGRGKNDFKKELEATAIKNLEETIAREAKVLVNIWLTGDGDGNPKQNQFNLEENLLKAQAAVKEMHTQSFGKLLKQAEELNLSEDEVSILNEASETTLTGEVNDNNNITESVAKLSDLKEKLKDKPELKNFSRSLTLMQAKLNSFKNAFAQIEVRHNAIDITDVIAHSLEKLTEADKITFDNEKSSSRTKYVLNSQSGIWEQKTEQITEAAYAEHVIEQVRKINADKKKIDSFPKEAREHYQQELFKIVADKNILTDKKIVKHTSSPEFVDSFLSDELKKVAERVRGDDTEYKASDAYKDDVNTLKKEAENNRSYRLFGRFQVMMKYPEAFFGLIIAECENDKHAYGALALLQMCGYEIPEKGKSNARGMHIIPLFESRLDLEQSHIVIAKLMTNESFRKNVSSMRELIEMIAKSDTSRQSGSSAVAAQEEAIAFGYLLTAAKYTKDIGCAKTGDLVIPEDARYVSFSGSGGSLNRDGLKPTELPYNVAKAILRMTYKSDDGEIKIREQFKEKFNDNGGLFKLDEDLLQEVVAKAEKAVGYQITIQGHQSVLELTGKECAAKTIIGTLAQAANQALKFLSVFKTNEMQQKHLKEGKNPQEIINFENKIYAANDKSFMAGQEFYENRIYNPKHDMATALRIFGDYGTTKYVVALGNVASRPGKRVGNAAETDPNVITVAQLVTNVPDDPTKQRAIGLDKTATHSGTYFTILSGACENLTTLIKGLNPKNELTANFFEDLGKKISTEDATNLNKAYQNSKQIRNFVRKKANALTVVDFEYNWKLMGFEGDKPKRGSNRYNELLGFYKEIYNNEYFSEQHLKDDKGNIDLSKLSDDDKQKIARATAVYLEENAHRVAELSYITATGKTIEQFKQENPEEEFTFKSVIKHVWPEDYPEVELREKLSAPLKQEMIEVNKELVEKINVYKNAEGDEKEKLGQEQVEHKLVEIARAVYAGLEAVLNTTVSSAKSVTNQPEHGHTASNAGNVIMKAVKQEMRKLVDLIFPSTTYKGSAGTRI